MDQIERELQRAGRRYQTGIEKLTRERNEAIIRASEAGKTYRQIARRVGVNHQRVGKIIAASRAQLLAE